MRLELGSMHEYHHITSPFDNVNMIFRVTRGSKLTPMEKLAKPFDLSTWITTTVTFFAGFLVIFIIDRFFPRYVHNFVYGIPDPTLGLLQIFFGIGFVTVPGRNFARFFFMMITILCLIIRTAYQSKMFDFLQYDERQPHAATIQDIIDRHVPLRSTVSLIFESNDEINGAL